jgi:hypothetical protein
VAGAILAAFLFVTAAEGIFWNEFGTRFNFIAVDYLVYTREVVGNIRESYDLRALFAGLGLALAAVGAIAARPFARVFARPAGSLAVRSAGMALVVAVALARDGARRHRLEGEARHAAAVAARRQWRAGVRPRVSRQRDRLQPFLRDAARRPRRTGARRMSTPSCRPMRSPTHARCDRALGEAACRRPSPAQRGARLRRKLRGGVHRVARRQARAHARVRPLARDGLFFTNLYATGTRTVRGLEALTLSVPPTRDTPSHAAQQHRLFTLGGVFRDHGYDALYLYGGYSYFDNMKSFFGGNGYTVMDRNDIPRANVSHETIWGVADEDLFGQALAEMDRRVSGGSRVFMHVMTTSNHRPFTYPAGRIDVPSGSGRDGAVKYTDYAIGRFIREAGTRPWFADTVFVIVADHTSIGRGKTSISRAQFHIPMVMYAPRWIAPRRVDTVASQIDVGPTILGLLNFAYRSQFFGRDILNDGEIDPHVFMANYQTVGFLDDGLLAELRPRRATRVVKQDTDEAVVGPARRRGARRGDRALPGRRAALLRAGGHDRSAGDLLHPRDVAVHPALQELAAVVGDCRRPH